MSPQELPAREAMEFDVAIVGMGRSIHFDDEKSFAAEKIYGERSNGVLSDELIILQTSATQA